MLLGTDGYRRHLGGATGLVQGLAKRNLPVPGVALPGPGVALDLMGRPARSHDAAIVHIYDEDLGRLRRAIRSGN